MGRVVTMTRRVGAVVHVGITIERVDFPMLTGLVLGAYEEGSDVGSGVAMNVDGGEIEGIV